MPRLVFKVEPLGVKIVTNHLSNLDLGYQDDSGHPLGDPFAPLALKSRTKLTVYGRFSRLKTQLSTLNHPYTK